MLRVLLLASLFGSLAAHAYELRRDSTGAPVHWGPRATFVMDSRLPDQLQEPGALEALRAAVATLQAAAPALELGVTSGVTHGVAYDTSAAAANESAVVALDDWPYDENAIAVTIVSVDTERHEVVDADIALNLSSHQFRKLPPDGDLTRTYDDLQNTLTHELGHALGLAHVPDEPTAVMYPGAIRGEVSKRVLSADDAAGLAFLYPAASAAPAPSPNQAVGCSSVPATPEAAVAFVAWALLLVLLRTRPSSLRRRLPVGVALGAACALCPLAGFAATPRPPAAVLESRWTATGTVRAARVLRPDARARMLWTELTVSVGTCHHGPCPAEVKVRVPGGKLGHLEQWVEDAPVPTLGASLGVTWTVEAQPGAPRTLPYRVYVLERGSDFVAFAEGLRRAQGSASPRTSGGTPRARP